MSRNRYENPSHKTYDDLFGDDFEVVYEEELPPIRPNDTFPEKDTASCIYTQKGNKKIRKPQAANQTALIFDRRAAARLLSINSIRRLCWS